MPKDEHRLSPEDLHVVRITILSSCALSLVGCSYILWHYVQCRRAKRSTSMTQDMVFILSLFDFLYSFPKLFGRAAIDHKGACVMQGLMLSLIGPMSVTWNCCMAHSVYRRIVCRDSEPRVRGRMRTYLLITTVPSIIGSIVQVSLNMFGDAIFYCWIAERKWHFLVFYLWVILSIVYVSIVLCVTQAHISRRARLEGNVEAMRSSSLILLNLRIYIVTFAVLWVPSVVFRLFGQFIGKANFPLAVMMQATSCLQGFATSVIYGGLLTRLMNFCHPGGKGEAKPRATSPPDESAASYGSTFANAAHEPLDIFVSTFNVGEGKVTPLEVARWLPLGYDIYVIGVQECLYLGELRALMKQRIERHRGHSSRQRTFEQFGREIGSTNTSLGYHGHIALTIYVRSNHVRSGAFFMPPAARQEVNCGKSLVFGRAANKGAVGFAFRYFDTSFAFVTCHLSSDSKGKSKVLRRNSDAEDMLRQLHLNVDEVGFEFPLMHHHSFVLGDLNYRLTHRGAKAHEILELLSDAHNTERAVARSSKTSSSKRPSSFFAKGLLRLRTGSNSDYRSSSSNPSHLLEQPLTDQSAILEASVSTTEDLVAARWKEVLLHDELSQWMQSDNVFYGFRENNITFAPSYRRQRHTALADDSIWTAEALTQLYTTRLENGEERVPSYTDRILHYSQADMETRLFCSRYNLCEEVMVSDHKPVVAVFHALVNRDFRPLERPERGVLSMQRIQDMPNVFECTLALSYTSVNWVHDIDIGWRRTTDDPANPGTVGRVGRRADVSVVFPLPAEDIFSEQRKLHQLADTMRGGVYVEEDDTLLLRTTSTTLTWTEFVRTGVTHSTLTRLAAGMHAAIKIDDGSKCLGQGVLALKPEWVDACLRGLTGQYPQPQPFELDLCAGGALTGRLSGTLQLRLYQTIDDVRQSLSNATTCISDLV